MSPGPVQTELPKLNLTVRHLENDDIQRAKNRAVKISRQQAFLAKNTKEAKKELAQERKVLWEGRKIPSTFKGKATPEMKVELKEKIYAWHRRMCAPECVISLDKAIETQDKDEAMRLLKKVYDAFSNGRSSLDDIIPPWMAITYIEKAKSKIQRKSFWTELSRMSNSLLTYSTKGTVAMLHWDALKKKGEIAKKYKHLSGEVKSNPFK